MNDLPEKPDSLLHPRWIIPVVPQGQVLEGHSVVVHRGRIAAILPTTQTRALDAGHEVELCDHVLLPGLVNAHGHAAMCLLRGFADDYPLMPWLQEHIWPIEQTHVNAEFVHDGSLLAMAEMLRAGTTTFADMYFFPEKTARAAHKAGLRCQLAFPILDFPTVWGSGPEEYLHRGLALRDEYKHHSRIHVVFGPHAPYTAGEKTLSRIAVLAAELDLPVHIHLHETRGEVLQAVERCGERPLDTLNRLGLLGPRTQCVHMTDLGEQDIALLADTGAHVIHCPQSNMKLAAGICPVSRLQEAGINVALGTDGAASNNNLNLFGEMRSAALLAKLHGEDPATLPAATVLEMATLGGARALGLEELIGSIEPGKAADLVAVDLSGPETQPVHHPLSQLVYACNGSQVSHCWVDGKPLLENRRLLTLDSDILQQRCRNWQQRIATTGDHR